jgi:hypothetical protein
LTGLSTRPPIATKRSTARGSQSVSKFHAQKICSAIFARILTAVHTKAKEATDMGKQNGYPLYFTTEPEE